MTFIRALTTVSVVTLLSLPIFTAAQEWKPAAGPLMTRWAKDVAPDKALPEYPRPQLVRKEWVNLNGLWDYAIAPKADATPNQYQGKILVPYPVESALSGVMKRVGADNKLWYRRTFDAPRLAEGGRLLLHFGAVDWETTVWLNGKQIGSHRGGYDPFTFDVTDALKATGPQELIVSVWDPTNDGQQPRGKQVKNPGGIFYTSVTGIWQTAWLEPVPKSYIRSLKITPDVDGQQVKIQADTQGDPGQISATVLDGDREIASANGTGAITIKIDNPRLWSGESPFLYGLRVKAGDDAVESYFGLRKIEVKKDDKGVNRIYLNNHPIFMVGPLDQGFWPDGIYTAPTDEALKSDIEITKKLGFNATRKHVKVEPARWYYWCDKLGLLVWQDMPAGDNGMVRARRGQTPTDKSNDPKAVEEFDAELKSLIDTHYNHPSIIMWVVFNEGWGQHETPRTVNWVKQYDPSRLINPASGWTDHPVGDVI
ncbi:MAG TPA: glycoside hydrolase family 2 TIM barrel-domain containing protein, partial [Tepidisphaeraceae bacterium]